MLFYSGKIGTLKAYNSTSVESSNLKCSSFNWVYRGFGLILAEKLAFWGVSTLYFDFSCESMYLSEELGSFGFYLAL